MARGDDEFVEFARAASPRLVRAAYLLTGDRVQAEDVAQTALVRTYAAWSRVRRQDAYAYARTVLVNHLTDGWRRPVRERPTDELPERPAADDVAGEVARRRWLIDVLAALSPRERAVIVLRHYFDLSETDVAAQLKVSVGTVKSTNSRALDKLRAAAGTDGSAGPGASSGPGERGGATGGYAPRHGRPTGPGRPSSPAARGGGR